MEASPKVSIIMPSLNVVKYIREAIESVINQTMPEIEVICVDAGSTDGTLEILREYEKKDDRIKIIISDKKSYGYQMNIGIKAAQGEYVGIVETDDYILPHMYKKLYSKAKQFDLDIIKADYYYVFSEEGIEKRKYFQIVIPQLYGKVLNPKEEKRCVTFVITCSGIYKKAFLDRNNIRYNETPGASYQDNGFYFQTHCCAEKMYFLKEPLYCYRRDNPNSSIHHPGKVFLICGEYEFIYSFLKRYPHLYDAFIKRYCRDMFYAYLSNYRRIAEEYKLQFLKQFSSDFYTLKERGELYPEVWDKTHQQLLQNIMQDAETFYFNDRAPHYLQIQLQKGNDVNSGNTVLQMEIKRLNKEISNIHTSWTYRIGRFITFFPRKLRGGIRCYKEHGLRYTLNRIPQKFDDLQQRWKKSQNKTRKAYALANMPVVLRRGCSTKKHTPELIVSLTSFPARIRTVHITINTILRQTERPDRVILWLAKEQFPYMEKELPKELLSLRKYGLEIKWCHDIKSYKKLIPTLREYPEAIIVTADDDVYYTSNWLELLYASYQKWPDFVHAHRNTCFYLENGEWNWIPASRKVYPCPSYLHKLVGVGGVLYPPHSLHPDVLREDLFTDLSRTNDDIWFWFMAIRNHYKILVIEHNIPEPKYVEGTQGDESLTKINDQGPNYFRSDFQKMLTFYPDVKDILEKECSFIADFEKCALVKNKDYNYYANLLPQEYEANLTEWFYRVTGGWLNLDYPKTFNEKIQWLKIYDSTPIKTRLADKYLVRDWVKDKIGEEYLIPLLGVWDCFDEIDFDRLPDQFVLKANHGSGWNVIVEDKTQFDVEATREIFDTWLKTNFAFSSGFEIHYMNIPPKIIAEKYIGDTNKTLFDYRFFCFNGKPKYVWLDSGSGTANHKRNIYDLNWLLQDYSVNYPQIKPNPPKPDEFDKILELADILCKEFALVRVDFYMINNKIYFGEMTFTPQTGAGKWNPTQLNRIYGDMIDLPLKSPLPQKLL